MLAVSKRILDAVQTHYAGQPLPQHFWWVVGLECGLASLAAVAGRTIGFLESLLADRFTRHVSLLVMDHASRLDLASYEDPVFYDKLERARVQATDRIAMIQAIGAVGQQMVAAVSLSLGIFWFSPWLLVVLGGRRRAGVSRREPFRISRLCAKHPADSGAAATGLPAPARRQQGIGKGAAALRSQRLPVRRICALVQWDL